MTLTFLLLIKTRLPLLIYSSQLLFCLASGRKHPQWQRFHVCHVWDNGSGSGNDTGWEHVMLTINPPVTGPKEWEGVHQAEVGSGQFLWWWARHLHQLQQERQTQPFLTVTPPALILWTSTNTGYRLIILSRAVSYQQFHSSLNFPEIVCNPVIWLMWLNIHERLWWSLVTIPYIIMWYSGNQSDDRREEMTARLDWGLICELGIQMTYDLEKFAKFVLYDLEHNFDSSALQLIWADTFISLT